MDLISACHSAGELWWLLHLAGHQVFCDRLDAQRDLVLLINHFHRQMHVLILKINYLFTLWGIGEWCTVTLTMPFLDCRHGSKPEGSGRDRTPGGSAASAVNVVLPGAQGEG